MSFLDANKPRRVVPRWRVSSHHASILEASSLSNVELNKEQRKRNLNQLNAAKAAWEANPTLGFATDLVNSAYVLGSYDIATEAAFYILHDESAAPEIKQLARRLVGNDLSSLPQVTLGLLSTEAELRNTVRQSKLTVRRHPSNSLAWLDLARAYVVLGEGSKAERAIRTALHLAPGHRLPVRAAVRHYLHQGNPEAAEWLLRRSPSTPTDPWLVSAEIAVSSIWGRPPRFVRQGRQILESADFTAFSTSELAASLGSLELENGRDKQAKRLMQAAMIDPTENAVAQAEWIERVGNVDTDHERHLNNPDSFEARAWAYYLQSEFDSALLEARHWLISEPFSSRPAMFASHIVTLVSEDLSEAVELMRRSHLANPGDAVVMNDLSYALALNDQVEEATEVFLAIDVVDLDVRSQIVNLATGGLLAFRLGAIELGRKRYQAALDRAQDLRDLDLQTGAAFNYAREEARLGNFKVARTLLDRAKKTQRAYEMPGLAHLISRLESDLPPD